MRRATLSALLLLTGCYESFTLDGIPAGRDAAPPIGRDAGPPPIGRDAGPPPVGRDGGPPPIGVDAGPPLPPRPARSVDLLYVVDDSSSMIEEQASLAAELPRVLSILTTGDFDQNGRTDDPEDFTPVGSIHLGIVTTDMGVGGFVVPTCDAGAFGDDGRLRDRGDARGCRRRGPEFLEFIPDSDELPIDDAICRAQQGGEGCGFEQPLEAALKALSPARPMPGVAPGYEAPRFFRDTVGHGDGPHWGFVGADTLLAVVFVTDEDDCSAEDPRLYDLGPSSPYVDTSPNLRCPLHGDEALHPIGRYVRGLVQLRADPRRLIVSVIAGVPVDLVSATGDATQWDRLLSEDPDVRDSRMIERVDPRSPDRLVPSCNVPGRGTAFPPIRILETARGLEGLGARVRVDSVCQESFRGVLIPILDAL